MGAVIFQGAGKHESGLHIRVFDRAQDLRCLFVFSQKTQRLSSCERVDLGIMFLEKLLQILGARLPVSVLSEGQCCRIDSPVIIFIDFDRRIK